MAEKITEAQWHQDLMKQRKENPGRLGSRSNPHPPGTPPHIKAGMSESDYNKLDDKHKSWFED
jgi:hypothetical protein